MTENVKLVARETRLTTLAVDGDYSGTSAPIIATYLKTPNEKLFALSEQGVPVYRILDIIIPPKNGLNLRNIEVVFIAPSSADETSEDIQYSLSLEPQFILSLLPLHLVGETYISVFSSETRVHPKKRAISNSDLQMLLNLPELGSDEFKEIANKISPLLSPRALSSISGIENIIDSVDVALAREIRGKLLLTLSELANGSEASLLELLSYINPLNAFEEKIMINQHEQTVEDDKIDALISITDRILSRTNIRNVIPKRMKPEEIQKFQEDYNTFNEIMEDLDEDGTFLEELDELSANDRKFLENRDDTNALTVYLNSPITRTSLPAMMAPLVDKIDFASLYERDWSLIDSVEDFLDEEGEADHSFGENVIIALIASIIRIGRISEINNIPPVMFLISILSDSDNTQDGHWELMAFTERLANGDTSLFKDLITILPPKVPMSQLLNMSYLGFLGFALARSIINEKWSLDIIHIALNGNQIMVSFVDMVFSNMKEIKAQYIENLGGTEIDEEHQEMIDLQISLQAIQTALVSLGEEFDSGEEIASAIIDAMLKLADLNTGKKTLSTVNSEEWITVKKEYLENFLTAPSMKSFEE